MYCLGIESTAHTFSCAVIEKKQKNGKILSDVRKIYKPPEGEGIHPREASRHHIENSSSVLKQCLDEAKIKINDLDMIAYAGGPGLGPCLRVGAVVARSLSSYYDIPIYQHHYIQYLISCFYRSCTYIPKIFLVGTFSFHLASLMYY